MTRDTSSIPLMPFFLGSMVCHVALLATLTIGSSHEEEEPQLAIASQKRVVRLVLPPLPVAEPEPPEETPQEPPPEEPPPQEPPPPEEPPPKEEPPPPDPLPPPEPTPEPEVRPEPIPEPIPEPAPIEAPELPIQEPLPPEPVPIEPPPIETPPVEVTPVEPPPVEPPPITPPEPQPPEPQPPEPQPPEPRPVEDSPPEDQPPQEGEADEDEAAVQVDAVPDPAFAPRPKYPRKARVRRWEGTVLLEVEVSETGAPLQVSLRKSSGHTLLDEAALETVRTWKFVPGQKNGRPAKTTVQVPVTFRLVDR